MTSTKVKDRARQIIETIIAKLDDGLVKRRLDDPVGAVVREFDCNTEYPVDHRAFNETIARLVGEIYTQGLRSSMPPADPLAEAISLLENGYQSGTYGPGYVAAMLDANNEAEGGMHSVVASLGELLKDRERRIYTKGVLASCLPMGDWHLQCEIVRTLLEDYEAVIPEALSQCAPAQLVEQIPSIMCSYIHSDSVLRSISFPDGRPPTAETALPSTPLWL
jgi:hypothetical protein